MNKEKVFEVLQAISLGRIQNPLYFKKKRYYSSTIGGVFTLILLSFLLITSIVILARVFSKSQMNLEERAYSYGELPAIKQIKVRDFMESFGLTLKVNIDTRITDIDCSRLELNIYYSNKSDLFTIGTFSFNSKGPIGDFYLCDFQAITDWNQEFNQKLEPFLDLSAIVEMNKFYRFPISFEIVTIDSDSHGVYFSCQFLGFDFF